MTEEKKENNNPSESQTTIHQAAKDLALRKRQTRNLIAQIFKSDSPEKTIKKIPAQSLFIAVKSAGLPSASEVLEIATREQIISMLDFDCWNKDEFNEDNFWEWLAVTDSTENLDLLQKILSCCDLKWVGLLISRYLDVKISEEPTELSPGADYITPDKGYTWLRVKDLNSDKEFLLNRLLALIFDTNAELFYQLISIPSVSTPSLLEEESFQDKEKRHRSQGIFNHEESSLIHSGIGKNELSAILKNNTSKTFDLKEITTVEPLVFNSQTLEPLGTLMDSVKNTDELLAELSLLINTAIIRWNVPFYELETVEFLTEKIKGILNIGLLLASKENNIDPIEAYSHIGLSKFYQRGLFECLEIRKKAYQIKKRHISNQDPETEGVTAESVLDLNNQSFLSELLNCLCEDLPSLPSHLKLVDDKIVIDTHSSSNKTKKGLENLKDLELVKLLFQAIEEKEQRLN